MAKPDTVVTLSDEDKEWLHNEISGIQVSIPEIPASDSYSEILIELLACMKGVTLALREVTEAYKRLHGVPDDV